MRAVVAKRLAKEASRHCKHSGVGKFRDARGVIRWERGSYRWWVKKLKREHKRRATGEGERAA